MLSYGTQYRIGETSGFRRIRAEKHRPRGYLTYGYLFGGSLSQVFSFGVARLFQKKLEQRK